MPWFSNLYKVLDVYTRVCAASCRFFIILLIILVCLNVTIFILVDMWQLANPYQSLICPNFSLLLCAWLLTVWCKFSKINALVVSCYVWVKFECRVWIWWFVKGHDCEDQIIDIFSISAAAVVVVVVVLARFTSAFIVSDVEVRTSIAVLFRFFVLLVCLISGVWFCVFFQMSTAEHARHWMVCFLLMCR